MDKGTPDHRDAELLLRVYEIRREAVMRESRSTLTQNFRPRSYEEVLAVTRPDHPLNAPWRQVGTYWEMVYGFARHGIVHADFWLESNGEGLLLFAKVKPHLERLRAELNPAAFRNAEWVSKECAEGRRLLALFLARVEKALAGK